MQASTPLTEGNSLTAANNKYQKALKQINKLIVINNNCKKQLITLQGQFDQLTINYGHLQQKYIALKEEHQTHAQGQGLMMRKVTLSYEQPSSQVSIKSMEEKNSEAPIQNKGKQNYSPLSLPGKQLQNTGTISQYVDTKRLLQEMEEKLAGKETQISCLVQKLRLKDEQNADLLKKYAHITSQIQIKGTSNLIKLEKQKSELEKELAKQRSISVNMALQLENIKKVLSRKITSQETISIEQKLSSLGQIKEQSGRPMAVPFHQSYYSIPLQSVNKNSAESIERTDNFYQYYFKKVKNLETEMVKLKKQFTERKQKYKNQINKLKHQLLMKQEDLKKLNIFIEKQQYFIQNYALRSGVQQQSKLHQNEGVDEQKQNYLREDKIISGIKNNIGNQKYKNFLGLYPKQDNQVSIPSSFSSASKYLQQFSNSKYPSQTKSYKN